MNAGDHFKRDVAERPEDWIQPWMKHDRMNSNRLFVNPEFVKKYGNPHNKKPENKYDIYVEILNEEEAWREYQATPKKNQVSWDPIKAEAVRNLRRAWYSDYEISGSSKGRGCLFCSATNPRMRVNCWNCLQKI
jgi:hypothetical protein